MYWRLEIGDWRLEIGDWRLEIGDTMRREVLDLEINESNSPVKIAGPDDRHAVA